MPVEKHLRDQFFTSAAEKIISTYAVRKERSADLMSALRLAHLFTEVMLKIYGVSVGQDATFCFRDWALENKLRCREIAELEYKGEKKLPNPYFNPSKRLMENISFRKYTTILERLLMPPRQPLLKRTPVRRVKDGPNS